MERPATVEEKPRTLKTAAAVEDGLKNPRRETGRSYMDANRRIEALTRWTIGLPATIPATLLAASIEALRILTSS